MWGYVVVPTPYTGISQPSLSDMPYTYRMTTFWISQKEFFSKMKQTPEEKVKAGLAVSPLNLISPHIG